MTSLSEIISNLTKLLTTIRTFPDPRRATAEWKQAYNLLKKTDAAGNHLDNVIARRDVEELDKMIQGLVRAQSGEPAEPAGPVIDEGTLKSALKAFKRRLKLSILDEESKLDLRDPMSKGELSAISAVEPPREWGAEVWTELVRRGALRASGRGMYEFVRDLT